MSANPRSIAASVLLGAALLNLGACSNDLLNLEDDRPTTVQSSRIKLDGASESASFQTTDETLHTAGTVISVARQIGRSLASIASASAEGAEEADNQGAKAATHKVQRTENCADSGRKIVDITVNFPSFDPEGDVQFEACREGGLSLNGFANVRCDNFDCDSGNAILGRDFNELEIASGNVSALFAGVGDYRVLSRSPLAASLASTLKIQVNLGDATLNVVTGTDSGLPLQIDYRQSAGTEVFSLNGSLGLGESTTLSQCGQGRFEIETLQDLQLSSQGQPLGGQLRLRNPDAVTADLDFLSDGGVTITLADGSPARTYTAEELRQACAF